MTDLKERVFQHWDFITALGVRRFGSTTLAEEAVHAALEALSKDDWQRLKKYKGEASFKSFLSVLVVRLFEDFARKRFGRIRPPAWITRLGGIWPKLFIALCLERLGVQWATEIVHQQEPKQGKSEIEEAAYILLGRIPNCGAQTQETALDESREAEAVTSQYDGGESGNYERKEKVQFIENICVAICGEEGAINTLEAQEKFSQLEISLTTEERLLLKLHFQDGMNVTEAGRMLDLNRFQVHGKLKRLMKKLKQEFDRVGLTQEIRQMLR